MRVRFEGFGPNFATGMLVFLVAVILAGAVVLAKPAIAPDESRADAAVVWPCKPYAWREKAFLQYYDVIMNRTFISARVQYNGCEVKLVPGSLHCWSKGAIYVVTTTYCGSYRVNLQTAYGQNLRIVHRFKVGVFWSGFPLEASDQLCLHIDRRGIMIARITGIYSRPC